MANVGKNIKKLRTTCKMTQEALAEKLFVSRQTVSNYENGKSNPDIDMLVKMAEIFGTDVNTLIYGPPVPVDRKREYWKLGIVAAIATIITISLILLPKTEFAVWCRRFYFTLPASTLYMYIQPALYIMLGWLVMQFAGLFLGAKQFRGKYISLCRRIIIVFLIAYLILLLPVFIEEIIETMQWWHAHQMNMEYSHGPEDTLIPEILRRPGSNIWLWLLLTKGKYNLIYLFVGIFFWVSAPLKKDIQKPVSQPKEEPK